jgi:hypothetical protein
VSAVEGVVFSHYARDAHVPRLLKKYLRFSIFVLELTIDMQYFNCI